MTSKQIKHLIFAFLMFAVIALLWWQLVSFFTSDNIRLQDLIYLGTSLMVFLIFTLLFLVLADNRKVVYLTFLVSSGIFFLFFKFNYIYLISIVVFLVFLIIAYERIGSEQEDRIRVSLKKFWVRGLPFIIVSLCLIVSVAYYFNPLLKIEQEEIQIPPQVMGLLLKPLGGMLNKALPFYSPGMTIDEILAGGSMLEGEGIQPGAISPELLQKIDPGKLATMDISELLKDPEIGALLREEMGKQTEKIDPGRLAQQRNDFAEPLGITLKGDETLDVVLTKIVNSKVGEFIGPYGKIISIGIAVSLFFILRLVGIVLGLIAMLFGQIIFLILKAAKVVQVEKVTKEAQVIKI